MYIPQEDSYLLEESVKKYAFGKVLDVGTGSGIQAISAAQNKNVSSVLAVDIDETALEEAKKNALLNKTKKITFKKSNLFSNVKGKFDTIIFNPPYLPEIKGESEDEARPLSGGKKGYELIIRFLSQANDFLTKDGIILIVFSSLTKKKVIENAIDNYGFIFEQLKTMRIFFEEIFVYKLTKNYVLKMIYNKNIKNIKKLAKGHRGFIYVGDLNNKKVAIKVQRRDIGAKDTVNREADWLKILNKKGIGPKLISAGDNYFIYEYVPGIFIKEFLEKEESKRKIQDVLVNVLKKCFILDELGISKEEMHNPYKHIVIGNKIVLLDFERAHYSEKPQNVTQFCQYIMKNAEMLNKKGFKIDNNKIQEAAKIYKNRINQTNFDNIISLIN